MLPSPGLKKILAKIKKLKASVTISETEIHITIDLTHSNLLELTPFLYILLNKYEEDFLIIIKGVPYCLLKDAPDHLLYKKAPKINYTKDNICRQCHYAHICPGWIQDTPTPRPTAVRYLPREIVLEVTNRCHLRCPICFGPYKKFDMSWNTLTRFIDECVDLGINDIRFTGGEPLLYKQLPKAIAYAKKKKRYIIVNTTATFLPSRIKNALVKYADNLLISLQGYSPQTNAYLTQSQDHTTSYFQKKLKNIFELNQIIKEVRIGTIISQTLIKNFHKYYRLISSLGIKYWELYRGMSPPLKKEFNVSPQDLSNLINQIHSIKSRRKAILIANPVPFCITPNHTLNRNVLYGAQSDDGHSRLIVDVQGYLKPSYLISKNLGNTIKQAWHHPFLEKLKKNDYLPSDCHSCDSLNLCKGGSRYWANLTYNTYYEKDPLMKCPTLTTTH